MIKQGLIKVYILIFSSLNRIMQFILHLLTSIAYLIPFFRKGCLDANNTLIKSRIRTRYGEIVFSIVNWHTYKRVNTFFSKEPGTLIWIDEIFEKEDCFFDVGANIGLYTLYAASKGVNVVAFEPDSQNYSLLYKNIWNNSFGSRVTGYNIALSDSEGFGDLYVAACDEGSSMSNFGSATQYIKEHDNLSQGVYSTTIDSYVEESGIVPNHIKIDVDGIELSVLEGAKKTLNSDSFKSLQLEVNLPVDDSKKLFKYLFDEFNLVQYENSRIADSQFKNSRDEKNVRFIKKV